jgi:hypothetical protein
VPEVISKLLATIQASTKTILATTKTHKWWWAGGGGATLVAVIALVIVFGGFFGPSGKAICTATLERARAFGVVPSTASLADNVAKKDDQVSGRRLCTAQAGEDKYVMSVDLTCNDMKKGNCISLYAVERADGLSTYQQRKEEPEESAAVLPPVTDQAAAPANGPPPAADNAQSTTGDSNVQPVTGSNSGQSEPQATPQQ